MQNIQNDTAIDIAAEWQKFLANRNDESSKNNLTLNYLSLVKFLVGRMSISLPAHVDKDDLVSVGIRGLIKALDRYDPACGTKFETYATIRIQGSIIDELRSMDWVPRSVRDKARKLQKAYASLEERLGRFASDDEVADYLGISLEELDVLVKDAKPATMLSMSTVMHNDNSDNRPITLIDALSDDGASPFDKAQERELKEVLIEALHNLSEQERRVIILYYYRELTLKEIGEVLNVSESRISQIHTKAVFRLRSRLSKSFIKE